MEISELSGMQQHLLTQMTESWTRLANAWTDTVKDLHEDIAPSSRSDFDPRWMNPWAFQSIAKSPSTISKFQEMIESAAKDLPELLRHGGEKDTAKNLKDKWLNSYSILLRETFGIPYRSETDRFLGQWHTLFGSFSGARPRLAGTQFPDFSAVMASMKSFLESGSGPTAHKVWTQNYGKMFDIISRLSGGNLTESQEDLFTRAMEAQIRFLKALPEFHEQIVAAASKALDQLISRIVSVGGERIGSDTYQEFYRTWISTHEEAMLKLLRSEGFSRTILETIHRGRDAKKEMEDLIAAGRRPRSTSSKVDLDNVNEEIRALRDRVGQLEQEIQAIKSELAGKSVDGDSGPKFS